MKHTIRIVDHQTGAEESFTCTEHESILSAMYRLGRKGIPSGCRGGGCGVCLIQVESGVFNTKAMSRCHVSEQDEAENRLLACRVFPKSDVTLSVAGKMKFAVGKRSETSLS